MGIDDIRRSEQRRDQWIAEHGVTFGVEGSQQEFAVDLMPRIITPHEWDALSEGWSSGPGRSRRSCATVTASSGSSPTACCRPTGSSARSAGARRRCRLPADAVRAPIMGFDLVRNEFGGWRVLEDNVRNPSGAAYAIAIRDLLDDVMPDLPRPPGLLDPADAMPLLR